MKTCLVLEGGAMRGIYTAGVLDIFLDNNIKFDGVIGVSAGAIHGSTYIAGQNGRSIRYYKKYCRDRRFMSIHSFVTTGSMVGKQFCYDELPNVLDPFDYEAFKNSDTDFYLVCTDIEKGKPVYVKCDDIKSQMDYLRASASMPIVSEIVEAGGRKLLDGGVTDSIPLRAAQKLGYDRIVVVQTQMRDYAKTPEGGRIPRLLYRKYPELVKAVENRHTMYNAEKKYAEQLADSGEIIVIQPTRLIKISRTEKNPDVINEMYLLGRHDAEAAIDKVTEFIRK